MNFALFTIVFLAQVSTFVQSAEYVCPPCNNTCDNVIHKKPGTCPSCNMTLVLKSAIQFEDLSADDFCNRITANPGSILLDVRSAGEFKGNALRSTYGHFKNAININIDDLEDRLGELEKYKDREILVYCSHSVRSPRAAMLLNEHGFKKVANLSGGVSALNVKGNSCLEKNFVVH